MADGVTPASGVVIYLYHTDQTGHYPKKGDEKGWGSKHGYLRGWVKTDRKGFYKFVTLRHATYPGRDEPGHIHKRADHDSGSVLISGLNWAACLHES